jgi:hypothetical protein
MPLAHILKYIDRIRAYLEEQLKVLILHEKCTEKRIFTYMYLPEMKMGYILYLSVTWWCHVAKG